VCNDTVEALGVQRHQGIECTSMQAHQGTQGADAKGLRSERCSGLDQLKHAVRVHYSNIDWASLKYLVTYHHLVTHLVHLFIPTSPYLPLHTSLSQDGERILDMTLSSPIDAHQLRDSLMRFVEERLRLELLTAQTSPSDLLSSHARGDTRVSHTSVSPSQPAPQSSAPPSAPVALAASAYTAEATLGALALSPIDNSASPYTAAPPLAGSRGSSSVADVVVRQSGRASDTPHFAGGHGVAQVGVGGGDAASRAEWPAAWPTLSRTAAQSALSRASVQAQVDDIQQRLGLVLRAPPPRA